MRDRRHDLALMTRSDELQGLDHPVGGVPETLAARADGLVGIGSIQLEGRGVEDLSLLGRHALPVSVVQVDQPVNDPDIGDPGLVGDDLRGGDGPAQRARVHGGQTLGGEPARGVHGVLVPLRVEWDVAASPVTVLHIHRRGSVTNDVEPAGRGGPLLLGPYLWSLSRSHPDSLTCGCRTGQPGWASVPESSVPGPGGPA